MQASTLIRTLAERGAELEVCSDRLRVRPPEALADELRAALRTHKAAIIAQLESDRAHRTFWTTDPRNDMTCDTILWTDLLSRAYDHDADDPNGLFGALHGLRCLGAQLATTDEGYRLLPGEIGEAYPVYRARYLALHAAALRNLLRQRQR
jgi:hypothetical protein